MVLHNPSYGPFLEMAIAWVVYLLCPNFGTDFGANFVLFLGLFRTNFSAVRTKKFGLIEGLVGRVLASGCSSIQGCLRPSWGLLCS